MCLTRAAVRISQTPRPGIRSTPAPLRLTRLAGRLIDCSSRFYKPARSRRQAEHEARKKAASGLTPWHALDESQHAPPRHVFHAAVRGEKMQNSPLYTAVERNNEMKLTFVPC